jgi:serine/threonine-protein kinase
LHIILKTAAALEYAHAQKTIHRDVKPDNILLTTDGVVKVADLGLAKDTSDDMALTKTGAGAGTPIYMAPEQARDVKHVDARVDIYALGIMLYVFLTGKPPFTGATLVDLISEKEKGKFDPIRRHNDEVPPKIDLIVDKMLAKDPKMRYARCQEVIDELEPLGMANDELSFLQREDSLLPASDRKTAKTKGPAALPAKTQSPAAKAATSAPKSADEETQMPEAEHDVWYFKLVTPEGRQIIKKVSAEQLRTLIKSGHLDPTSEISRHEKLGFRPAATFTEFQAYFKAREASTKANVKGHKYKSKMEEIVAEDERRRKYGWIGRLFKNVGGTVFGLIWIAVILGIVAAAGYFGWKYLNP